MVTDVGTELSVPMDMIMPNIPFSLLTAYQFWAFEGVLEMIWGNFNHLHHVCTNTSAHPCWIWLLLAFSLSIAVQILIAEALDKWLKKSYNTTTLIGWKCERDCNCYSLFVIKNHPLPWGRSHHWVADLYDHIHDHRHDWSTRRQDATRARKVIFSVAERFEKR